MTDKRSVATDALETLGTAPIPKSSARDAIHLAVEHVIAGQTLQSGQHIYLQGNVAFAAGTRGHPGIGIVDPFIDHPVYEGDDFWLVVYPRTITSLRHVWSHPSFPEEATYHQEKDDHYVATSPEESVGWLKSFAASHDCPSYEVMMAAVSGKPASNTTGYGRDWHVEDDYLTFYGSDAHGDIPDEFWIHVRNVLGYEPEHKPSYFSCSC